MQQGCLKMKIKVLFVAPYRGLRELALTLLPEQSNFDVIVKEADLSAAIPLIKHYEQQGIDFVISRGGTANLIKQYTKIPVIEIKVSGYDIIRALTLIKDYKMKVQMIGFPNICEGVLSIAQLLNIKIDYTTIHHEGEVENAVLEAQKNGAQVLLGDTVTVKTAQKHGLQGMMITSGKESVLEAFEQVIDIAKMMDDVRKRNSVYQSLVTNYRDGIAIFEESGDIFYCNSSFLKTFGKDARNLGQIQYDYPSEITYYVQKILELKEDIRLSEEVITTMGTTTIINGGRFHAIDKAYFYVSIQNNRLEKELESSIRFYRNLLPPTSFAQIVTSSEKMADVIERAKRLATTMDHLIIIGEKGTGKRFISNAIHTASYKKGSDFLEIEITKKMNTSTLEVLNNIKNMKDGTIFFKGFENLSKDDRKTVVELAHDIKQVRFIFAFDVNPSELGESNTIIKDQLFDLEVISLPPLRERLKDIDELIRLFIAKYNTKYGKQIVGIRQDVLDYLHEYSWPGNVAELKKKVRDFVKTASGNYIEKDDLDLVEMKKRDGIPSEHSIDLSKTLDEIEKKIITAVLEEENMNQTQAAKRLGINRTTLWRKLKT